MPLFICSKCGCIENTALSLYWVRSFSDKETPPLCSECDPEIGKWHNRFPKQKYEEIRDKERVLNPPKELK